QAPGRAAAEASPRPPQHAGGEAEGPAVPAPGAESRGFVRASSSLREARPHAGRAPDAPAHQPGLASMAGPPSRGGGDLPVVRPPVSHRDGADEAGPAADSGRPLSGVEADLREAPVPQLGEGADLPG